MKEKINEPTNICPACDSEANVGEAIITQVFRGEELKVLTPVMVCRNCNFQFLGAGQLDELRRRTVKSYRKKHKNLD